MTISSTNRKAGPFIGNDSASVFPFTFSVFSAADVYAVQLNTVTSVESPLALGVDYTVTLNADQSANPGGTLTLTAGPLATGLTLTLTTAVTPLQLTDLTNQGGFYPRVITRAFDKLTVLVQQILERLGRSLTLPLSTPANVSTALPVPEANKALVWNSTATGLANYDASQFATSIIGTNRVVDRFLANGTAGPYALSTDPLNINNTLVFVNGEYRTHNTYTVSGASITFGTTVTNGTAVEVVQQLAVTYPVTALSDNVVRTGNLIDDSVTAAKIATGAVGTSELADNSVTAAKIAVGAVEASAIADGAVEASAIADGSVTTVKLGSDVTSQLVPAGSVQSFAMSSAPTGWLKANGAAISRSTYATLFAAIGTTFGAGDGSTTFNLPDLRGEFIRGWDDGRGADTGRVFGSAQDHMYEDHTHGVPIRDEWTGLTGSAYWDDAGVSGGGYVNNGYRPKTSGGLSGSPGTETRPRNVALLYCIKF